MRKVQKAEQAKENKKLRNKSNNPKNNLKNNPKKNHIVSVEKRVKKLTEGVVDLAPPIVGVMIDFQDPSTGKDFSLTLRAEPSATEDEPDMMWFDTLEMEEFLGYETDIQQLFIVSTVFQPGRHYKRMLLSTDQPPKFFVTAEAFLEFIMRSNNERAIELKRKIWKLIKAAFFSGESSKRQADQLMFEPNNLALDLESKDYSRPGCYALFVGTAKDTFGSKLILKDCDRVFYGEERVFKIGCSNKIKRRFKEHKKNIQL